MLIFWFLPQQRAMTSLSGAAHRYVWTGIRWQVVFGGKVEEPVVTPDLYYRLK